MELTIGTEELSKALYRAQGIVEKKSTMPILASVLLRALAGERGALRVSAYDMEMGVSSEHPAEVRQEGAVALRHKELYDIVRSLPESAVTLRREASGQRVHLLSGSAEFTIVGSPAEEFPPLPRAEAHGGTVDPALVAEMIDKTLFAVSTDDTRYALTGILVEPSPKGLRMVATDGHRLAMVERELEGEFGLKRGVILPRKGVLELKRLLSEEAVGKPSLGFTETACVYQRDGVELVMRLLDGQFPDYAQVIPREAERMVTLPRGRFLDTLRRISLLSPDRAANAVKLELAEGLLRVTSQNPDLGEAREELPTPYTGAPLQIGFNARYLIDVLGAVGSDEVTLELCDELSPGVLRPKGGDGYTAVIMPMRI